LYRNLTQDKEKAQLPQRQHASNIAIPHVAKDIFVCWTWSSQWIAKCVYITSIMHSLSVTSANIAIN